MLTVAIIGRPNVGKSTLFNRLTGRRYALVNDQPGVTRDWREGQGHIASLEFNLIDTAGLEQAQAATLQGQMEQQTWRAVDHADVILFLIDARAGVVAGDLALAEQVRKLGKPIVLAANKAEGQLAEAALFDAYGLGIGQPIAISAEHGQGMAELFDALAEFEPKEQRDEGQEDEDAQASDEPLSIAIVGRPNVGKSTLMNRILGTERMLTGPMPGLTRDAIAVQTQWEGTPVKLVDTAGLRKARTSADAVEKLSVQDSLRTIQYAEVVVLVMDATTALEKQDHTIASHVFEEGRAMVIAINKWDLVENPPLYRKEFESRLAEVLAQWEGIEVVPISAESGKGLTQLFQAIEKAYVRWNKKLPTGQLNRWLEEMVQQHSPPLVKGRRLKIRYMTQTKIRPPTFQLFANLRDIPQSYLRYLTRQMREVFDVPGLPLRFIIRTGKNPYESKGAKK